MEALSEVVDSFVPLVVDVLLEAFVQLHTFAVVQADHDVLVSCL